MEQCQTVGDPAVVCSGFNRTGFVVCAYLILVCGLSVQEALANFAVARPPGVKHEKFVVEVRSQHKHMRHSTGHISACVSSDSIP